jgi:hypothetical protein
VPVQDTSGLRTTASVPDISHQLTGSPKTPAKNTQNSNVQPPGHVGAIFHFHVITFTAVGVLLNLPFEGAIIAAAVIIVLLVISFTYSTMARSVSTARILSVAIWDNELDKYMNNTRTADKGVELPTTRNEMFSPSNGASRSSFRDQTSHSPSGVPRTPAADTNSEYNKELNERNRDHASVASQLASPEKEVQGGEDDEDTVYSGPSRQDTETGLREPG